MKLRYNCQKKTFDLGFLGFRAVPNQHLDTTLKLFRSKTLGTLTGFWGAPVLCGLMASPSGLLFKCRPSQRKATWHQACGAARSCPHLSRQTDLI
eukprot:6266781-Amphidinium_carterae.1